MQRDRQKSITSGLNIKIWVFGLALDRSYKGLRVPWPWSIASREHATKEGRGGSGAVPAKGGGGS
uniref:Uncharacterized protein n=1 Tax=Oryza glumipatula TaxID=40148 RepID=A0A0E0BLB1_9ORYZ